ncbi:MAG: hypothetical protein QF685_09550 [Verrucomicrobiota bacterium]|nr:hypothetical protein [Verrucomicrobiota bacterium]
MASRCRPRLTRELKRRQQSIGFCQAMGRHGWWIPAAERAGAAAVQNVVAVAVAMARLEIIAADVVARSEDLEVHLVVPSVVARSEDLEVHLAVPSAVARSEDPEVHLVVPSAVAHSENLEGHLVALSAVAHSEGPVALPAEVENAAVVAVRTLLIIFTRRRKAAFFVTCNNGIPIPVYVGLFEV